MKLVPWTLEEDKLVFNLREQGVPFSAIVKELPHRSQGATFMRVQLLKTANRWTREYLESVEGKYVPSTAPQFRRFTDSEERPVSPEWTDEEVMTLYCAIKSGKTPTESLSLLPGRTISAVSYRMALLKQRGHWNDDRLTSGPPRRRRQRIYPQRAMTITPLEPLNSSPSAYQLNKNELTALNDLTPEVAKLNIPWGMTKQTPGVDGGQREYIRKRLIYDINALANELSLGSVRVARCIQDIASDDFRGSQNPSRIDPENLPSASAGSTVGHVFHLSAEVCAR